MRTAREGAVAVSVPDDEDGVFYNPEQELNRDLTIAALRAHRDRTGGDTYLDAMTASGIRVARAAADGWAATAVDVDPDAVELATANLRANDLDADVRRRDANVELHENWYDVVDLDPFGTPIPFVDAAFRGTRDLLCVTATDTAPLCGAHFKPGIRRYGAVPRNTEYHAEMGVRILLSALARTGARYDVGVRPLLTHATRHYVRTYLALERSATDANAALEHLGWIHHCQDCLHRDAEDGHVAHPPETCPGCGSNRVVTAGPVWIGPAHRREFVAATRERLDDDMGTRRRADRLLDRLGSEIDRPTHYDQHRLCDVWERSAGPMDEFLDALREAGYEASRTHYGGTTLKTDADVAAIREVTG